MTTVNFFALLKLYLTLVHTPAHQESYKNSSLEKRPKGVKKLAKSAKYWRFLVGLSETKVGKWWHFQYLSL